MNRSRRRENERSTISPIIIALLVQIFSHLEQLPVKPPVTIILLGMNISAHVMESNVFGYNLWNIEQNCLHPAKIVGLLMDGNLSLNRLFLSSLIHADDYHLYYNMLSLVYKGIHLETELGSTVFLQLVAFSLIVSHSLVVILAYILYVYFDYDTSYRTCAVGFSAVLFALKYVWNYKSTSIRYLQVYIYNFIHKICNVD